MQSFSRQLQSSAVVATLAIICGAASSAWAQKEAADAVSVPQLIKNLDSDNLRVTSSAARSLGVIFAPGGKGGDELPQVTELLIARLQSPKGPDLRRESAVALGKMRAKSAVDGLKGAMNDEDVQVAMAAGEAVGQVLPVDEARAFLIERGGEDQSESVQVAAYHGLAPICKAEDARFMARGLGAKNWRTQMDAVRGLERSVHAGAQLTPEDYDAVAGVLGNEVVNAADAAVHFFTHVRNEESLRAVLKAAEVTGDGGADDASWRERTFALRVIYHLGWPTTRDSLPVVIRQLGDRTTNVTNEAKRILNVLRKENLVTQADLFPLLLVELERAKPLSLRAGIMAEMGAGVERQFASRVAKVAAETLDEAADNPSQWQARAYSLSLIGASGYTGSMELVAKGVSDDVANVRQAAGTALAQLAPLCSAEQREVVAPLLQPLLDAPTDWRKTAIAAENVGFYANAESIEPLVLLLSHSVLNVRDGASRSLVTIVDGEDESLRSAVESAVFPELEKNERAWEFGAPVLGALEDRKSIPLLTTILKRGDWRSQASAAGAVAQIAAENKINDQELADSLIKAAQSEVVQVQDAANAALRTLNKEE